MFHRSRQHLSLIVLTATALLLTGPACSQKSDETSTNEADRAALTDTSAPATTTATVDQFIITPPPETAASLLLKRQEMFGWHPNQEDRVEYALKDVTKIVMFPDLGLGDQIEATLPPRPTVGWSVGQSVRLRLDAYLTALAIRFVIDTLPGERVQGEGSLGIFAVHAGDTLGREVEMPRTQSNTGRLDVLWRYDRVVAQINCCDLPPTFILSGFGNIGDTLTVIATFDRARAQYMTTIIGPNRGRTYPGRSYVRFRTERGEYQKDQNEYPYFYEGGDPGWVNLYLGSRWRGRKMSTEPVLTARVF